jgi:hypothetical protein
MNKGYIKVSGIALLLGIVYILVRLVYIYILKTHPAIVIAEQGDMFHYLVGLVSGMIVLWIWNRV